MPERSSLGRLKSVSEGFFGAANHNGSRRFRPLVSQRRQHIRLILHPTCIIKPAVDGCPLVAANSMEIEKVRFFFLQVGEKDHAAHVGGIVRVILSPFVVFPKQRPSCLFPHHVPAPFRESDPKGYA
jgi:hypothetical protein